MAAHDITPTRSVLLDLKRRIKLSQSGHKILKMKRDGLIIEFFEVRAEACRRCNRFRSCDEENHHRKGYRR